MRLKSFYYCVVEGKNEIGSHGADPTFQAGAYYVELMAEASKKHPHARLPTILMYVMGAHIGFVGAVFTKRPNLQVLVNPLVLFPHHTDIEIRTTAARYFGALRNAVHSLQEYYKTFPSTIDSNDNPEFPFWRKYTSLIDGKIRSFVYKAQLYEKLVFFFAREMTAANFVSNSFIPIRRARTWHVPRWGSRPASEGFEKLPGNWYLVVMDEIDSSFQHFNESHSSPALYKHLEQKLTDLHQEGFVHGDIRDVNLLVKEGDEHSILVMLVDFDWAGSIGKTRYPLYLNRVDIWRPDGAQSGSLILAEHDISMLDRMFGEVSLK